MKRITCGGVSSINLFIAILHSVQSITIPNSMEHLTINEEVGSL
jgi:hypothetical protein